jgi:hypothetical protein
MMQDVPVILQEKAPQGDYDCSVQIPPRSSDCLSLICSVIGTRTRVFKGFFHLPGLSECSVCQIWPEWCSRACRSISGWPVQDVTRNLLLLKLSNIFNWTKLLTTSSLFWDVAQRRLVDGCLHFGKACQSHLEGSNILSRNVRNYLPVNAA